MMIATNEFKNGMSIIVDGVLYQIVEYQHVKPGKGGAFVRTRLKNMKTKSIAERTFRAEEKIEQAYIENKRLQYMYSSGNAHHFMDQQTFEEIAISEEALRDSRKFLKDGMEINSLWYEQQIIEITLPNFINLKVEHTEPGIKGDTAKASFKPATLETGAVVQVPLFINTGDIIKVDTRTGAYVERA